MRKTFIICSLLPLLEMFVSAQASSSALATFFERRLAEPANATPPTYQSLWQVTSEVANSSPAELSSALPYLFEALKRDERDLAIQAELPLFAIGHRSDGGLLLAGRVKEIGALLNRSDERISGGATGILRNIMPSQSSTVVPIIISHLHAAATSTRLTEVELMAMLLDFRAKNKQAMKTVDDSLSRGAEPEVTIATLKMLGAHGAVSTPNINAFSLRALGSDNKYIQIAAIYTVHSLGSTTWSQAQPTLTKLASDPMADKDVKMLANKALINELSTGRRQGVTAAQQNLLR